MVRGCNVAKWKNCWLLFKRGNKSSTSIKMHATIRAHMLSEKLSPGFVAENERNRFAINNLCYFYCYCSMEMLLLLRWFYFVPQFIAFPRISPFFVDDVYFTCGVENDRFACKLRADLSPINVIHNFKNKKLFSPT